MHAFHSSAIRLPTVEINSEPLCFTYTCITLVTVLEQSHRGQGGRKVGNKDLVVMLLFDVNIHKMMQNSCILYKESRFLSPLTHNIRFNMALVHLLCLK